MPYDRFTFGHYLPFIGENNFRVYATKLAGRFFLVYGNEFVAEMTGHKLKRFDIFSDLQEFEEGLYAEFSVLIVGVYLPHEGWIRLAASLR